MAITTRCRGCNTKIEHMNTYCDRCKSKSDKVKRESTTQATKEADKFTNTSRWRSLKADIKRRDKGCCKLCFVNGTIEYRTLEVHHIHKRTEAPVLAFESNNLVTLCRECHKKIEKMPIKEQFKLVKMDYIEAPTEQGLEFYL